MRYVKGVDRNQVMMCTLDSFVDEESDARLIDAFVDHLDLEELNIIKSKAASEGRPAYDPRSMLKLYIYGAEHSIRSSRKLAEACRINVEVKWMTGAVTPDFRTISDFRKNNIGALKSVMHAFNERIAQALEFGYVSVDGSKIRANNSKDNNFTSHKLDDRIEWLDAHIEEYFRQMDALDNIETAEDMAAEGMLSRETLEDKLQEAQKRLDRYKGYRKYMEDNMETEILQTLEKTDAARKAVKGTGTAENGGYTYELIHTDKDGRDTVLFSNDEIGGEAKPANMEGLEQATNALDDWFYLQTLGQGESGRLTLKVAFEGETEVNDYMDTRGALDLKFAVELTRRDSTGSKDKPGSRVNTGDSNYLGLWSVVFAVAAVLLLILAILSIRRDRREAGSNE